jgi:7,8-dihydropterin-6-yl-methyl-4-(beta-D-ribofuranosyl)aminobenzene 5'-phosphate synthase
MSGAAAAAPVRLPAVDAVAVTTVVDNSVDLLRADETVARRFGVLRAGKIGELRAEHGLAHLVEVTRGRETSRIAFDFGLTGDSFLHNLRELGLDPGRLDALALSHGHVDHFGGLDGLLRAHRRALRPGLRFYGHPDHYRPRWMVREEARAYLGRLDRDDLVRRGLEVVDVPGPLVLPEGVLLSGEMHATEPFETIPPTLRVERDGAVVPDTFIGEQTLVAHVRDRGLVVVTSCSHRGVVGICRHATRVTGIDRVHAVVGGFHLSGLGEERIAATVDALRGLGVDHVVPQHCTGLEAVMALGRHLPRELVVSSTGTTFIFGPSGPSGPSGTFAAAGPPGG